MKRRSLRTQPAQKIQMRLSTRHLVAGAALFVVLTVGLFLYFNLGNSHEAKAAVNTNYKAIVNNGAWNSPATWSSGHVPVDGDTILIPNGITVQITDNKSFGASTKEVLNIQGTLRFQNAYDLVLGSASAINLYTGGDVTSGNGSSRLYIGNTMVYKGNVGIIGALAPATCSGGGCFSNVALPVSLTDFSVSTLNGQIKVEWLTANEKNNDYFTIERSADARSFEAIQKVKGAGNSKEKLYYQALDKTPLAGLAYYRLRQTDFNGETTLSKIVAILNESDATAAKASLDEESLKMETGPALSGVVVAPNPFEQHFNADFGLASDGPVSVQLTDAKGRVLEANVVDGVEGNNRYEYNDTHSLRPGMYLFNIRFKGESKTVKLIRR